MKRRRREREEAAKNRAVGTVAGIAAATDRIGPMVQHAADRVGPMAQSAADRVAPLAQSAVDRVTPLAQSAAVLVTPLAHQAAERVSPYAHSAVDYVSPLAHSAADRVTMAGKAAKLKGAKVAHDAAGVVGPRWDDALDRAHDVRDRVSDEVRPRVSGALAAAAASPLAVEATRRGRATLAAARGELDLPAAEEKSKKGGLLTWLAVLAALAGVAALVARKVLHSKDSQWNAAPRATTFPTAQTTASASSDSQTADAGREAPLDWAEATGQTPGHARLVPEPSEQQVVEYPEESPAASSDETQLTSAGTGSVAVDRSDDTVAPGGDTTAVDTSIETEAAPQEEVAAEPESATAEEQMATASATTTYAGDDAYVGDEPPEGFVIKGNERSMKYHLPDSSGYEQTTAEVWFRTEEAAQAAGFVRAQS